MTEAIQIVGVEDVNAALARLDVKVQSSVMRASLRAAGRVMQLAETEAAPVRPVLPSGTALPPGALKSDVTLAIKSVGGQLAVVVQPGKLTYHAARWVEYGHRLVRGGQLPWSGLIKGKMRHRAGRGHQIGDVPQHPYIRPAFEGSVRASVEAFAREFVEQLKRRG